MTDVRSIMGRILLGCSAVCTLLAGWTLVLLLRAPKEAVPGYSDMLWVLFGVALLGMILGALPLVGDLVTGDQLLFREQSEDDDDAD